MTKKTLLHTVIVLRIPSNSLQVLSLKAADGEKEVAVSCSSIRQRRVSAEEGRNVN